MRLQDKVAVITGSGAGQGRAAARLFAAEGAQVVVTDVNEPGVRETVADITGAGGTAIAVPADVSNEESVRELMQEAIRQFGAIDILYNNAGIAPFADDRFETLEVELWDRIHNVNLRGLFLCCKHAIPRMVLQSSGSVINTASVAGLIGIGGQLAYSCRQSRRHRPDQGHRHHLRPAQHSLQRDLPRRRRDGHDRDAPRSGADPPGPAPSPAHPAARLAGGHRQPGLVPGQ